MDHRLPKYLLAIVLSVALSGTAAAAKNSNDTMSFGFGQEFAGVTNAGDIKVDLYKLMPSGATAGTDLRIGAFGGEVMIDTTTFNGYGFGYKGQIDSNLAAYGMLFIDNTPTSVTNLTLGVAYTGRSDDFIFNGNAELVSANGTSSVDLRGAGFYPLSQNKLRGKFYLGAEIDLQLSPSPTTTDIYAGARWMPKKNIMLDLGLIASSGGTTTLATPAMVRLNIGF